SERGDARERLRRYGDALQKKHGNALRLRRSAVAFLVFERPWWQRIGEEII
ncbi:MAG: hypothetical protein GY866_32220, partial [Proteobacteria bacterium]|nr:hypothetical protein [Pseudomonadota bacterium]